MPNSVKGLRSEHSASSWSSDRRRHTTCHLESCICRDQSAITMRVGAGLTSTKLTPFFRSSTTGRTTDSKGLFAGEFSLHGKKITPQPFTGMVNVEQFRQLLDHRVGLGSAGRLWQIGRTQAK